jgi:hypothetical protein
VAAGANEGIEVAERVVVDRKDKLGDVVVHPPAPVTRR